MRRPASRTGALVLAALRHPAACGADDVGLPAGPLDDVQALTAAAQRHRVPGYVYRMVRRGPLVHEDAIAPLRAASMSAAATHLRVVHHLSRVGEVLDAGGIRWAVLKGPVLAARYHTQPQLRAYADLDLLVSGGDLHRAVLALEAHGATVHPATWPHALHAGWGEIPVLLPGGVPVDLHWHLLNRQTHRAHFSIDMSGVLGRIRQVEVEGTDVPTLDPVDTVAHLCLHAMTSGGNRLVWLKDVERVLDVEDLPWGAFTARVEGWGTALPTAVILDRTRDLVGADVPDAVIRRLAVSHAWLRLGRAVRHLVPPTGWQGHASPDRMVTRATRTDGLASSRELLTRSVHAVVPDRLHRRDRENGSFGQGIRARSPREHYLLAAARASEP